MITCFFYFEKVSKVFRSYIDLLFFFAYSLDQNGLK